MKAATPSDNMTSLMQGILLNSALLETIELFAGELNNLPFHT
jgi:hypothetical protein